MPALKIPTPLRTYTNGLAEVLVQGVTVGDAMQSLVAQFPTMRQYLYNGEGQLRPFVNLFVGENNIKDLQGLETPLSDGDKLLLIPSIAGGCDA